MAPPVSFCWAMSAISLRRRIETNFGIERRIGDEGKASARQTNRAAQQFKWKWNGKEPKWPMFIFNLYAAATVGGDGGAREVRTRRTMFRG